MSSISVDEVEKIAIEFLQKKRNGAKDITIEEVVQLDMTGKYRVSGTFQDPRYLDVGVSKFEVKIGSDKSVYEYKIA
jgi:hypothetical protein